MGDGERSVGDGERSVGVGLGVGEGVGFFTTKVGGVISIGFFPPINTGFGKVNFGCPISAPFINAVHTRAGKVPPVTEVRPPIPFNVCDALSLKNETEAASCGVYPLNQAEAFCSLVPVLPAAGLPKPAVPEVAVPLRTTPCRA